mmetsp:Transcript_9064/g.11144  ORF Transcript_9064/g.11144 Transcript_9064/m.11144 type:complete len:102 (+) Transcript_9064:77-382(+)
MRYPIISFLILTVALPLTTAEYPPIIFTKPSLGIRKIQKQAFDRYMKEINHADKAVINDVERTDTVVSTVTDASKHSKEADTDRQTSTTFEIKNASEPASR